MTDEMLAEEETENVEEEDTTELDLWTWGLSGQPATWALSSWTSLVQLIRAVNLGRADPSSVQDALDAAFPDGGYQAANVCLAHVPSGEFAFGAGTSDDPDVDPDLVVRFDLAGDEDLMLPDEQVRWDFGDGEFVYDAGGIDHVYAEAGTYDPRLTVMVAGTAFTSMQTVDVGNVAEPTEDEPLNPGDRARPATVFESETDALPNNNAPVTAEPVADESDGEYDPGAHTVDEVLAYVAEHPDESDAVYAAESAGKGRVTILDKL